MTDGSMLQLSEAYKKFLNLTKSDRLLATSAGPLSVLICTDILMVEKAVSKRLQTAGTDSAFEP